MPNTFRQTGSHCAPVLEGIHAVHSDGLDTVKNNRGTVQKGFCNRCTLNNRAAVISLALTVLHVIILISVMLYLD